MFEAIRRPEYTGENRCWPCTGVNALIVALAAAVLAVVSLPAALVLAAGGAGTIALRGYVVPYTPRFAPRLVDALPWDPFHPADGGVDPPEPGSLADGEGPEPEALLEALIEAGVIVPDGDRLSLDDGFRERWREEMRTLQRASDDDLAAAARDASAVASDVEVVEGRGRTYVVVSDGSDDAMARSWLTRPVAIAETAAVRVLSDSGLPPETATVGAGTLRMFLEACPACGGPVEETTASGCCGRSRTGNRPPRDVLACEDCNERLYTFPD
jgi:hypothetical protein